MGSVQCSVLSQDAVYIVFRPVANTGRGTLKSRDLTSRDHVDEALDQTAVEQRD